MDFGQQCSQAGMTVILFCKGFNLPEGSVVVMDNAAFHKDEAQQLLEEKGDTVLWLPPYSPDLNPIDCCWAVVKSLR